MCKYQNAAALYPRCQPGAGPSRNQRNREAAVTVNGGGLCFRQIDICTGDDVVGHACPIGTDGGVVVKLRLDFQQRLGQRRSEEHTSELQSLMRISYAVFCLKKKNLMI